jgi:hypothetical protein
MIHKSNIIPGLAKFIDSSVLSQYPPTSLKRIGAAGAIALYLNKNATLIDKILKHPMISAMDITDEAGMVDIETLRDVYRKEINRAGFLRVHLPILGNVDFTGEDLDSLYRILQSIDAASTSSTLNQ